MSCIAKCGLLEDGKIRLDGGVRVENGLIIGVECSVERSIVAQCCNVYNSKIGIDSEVGMDNGIVVDRNEAFDSEGVAKRSRKVGCEI